MEIPLSTLPRRPSNEDLGAESDSDAHASIQPRDSPLSDVEPSSSSEIMMTEMQRYDGETIVTVPPQQPRIEAAVLNSYSNSNAAQHESRLSHSIAVRPMSISEVSIAGTAVLQALDDEEFSTVHSGEGGVTWKEEMLPMFSALSERLRPVVYRDAPVVFRRSLMWMLMLIVNVVAFIVLLTLRLDQPAMTLVTVHNPTLAQFQSIQDEFGLNCPCTGPSYLNVVTFTSPGLRARIEKQLAALATSCVLIPSSGVDHTTLLVSNLIYDLCTSISTGFETAVSSIRQSEILYTFDKWQLASFNEMNVFINNLLSSHVQTVRAAALVSLSMVQTGAMAGNETSIRQLLDPTYQASFEGVQQDYVNRTLASFTPLIQDFATEMYPAYFDFCAVRSCTYVRNSSWQQTTLDVLAIVSGLSTVTLIVFQTFYRWWHFRTWLKSKRAKAR